MRIVAYVDGFSVYYAVYRGPTKAPNARSKWLNYRALFEAIFPDDRIELVRVYTAIAPNPPHDPDQSSRHNTYLRALRTVPNLEVHVGGFQRSKREAHLARPPEGLAVQQTVFVNQEKKSDVSLAAHLMLDAFDDRFDRAVVLTNDSDFVEPIRLIRERFGREVVVISPDVQPSKELKKIATASRILDRGLLPVCQLNDEIVDADGRVIRKPSSW